MNDRKLIKNASVNWIARLFLLLACNASALAGPCSGIQLETDKSQGVAVLVDLCTEADELSLGAVLRVPPGSRVWLVAPASEEEGYYQMVCQNRLTSSAIKLRLQHPQLPWIDLQSVGICRPWDGKRLMCDSRHGEKNAFVCVASLVKIPLWEETPALGTSLVLRSPSDKLDSTEKGYPKNQVLEALKTEAQMCRELYGRREPSIWQWTVTPEGELQGMTAGLSHSKSSQFSDCIRDVIQFFPYPKPQQPVFFSVTF